MVLWLTELASLRIAGWDEIAGPSHCIRRLRDLSAFVVREPAGASLSGALPDENDNNVESRDESGVASPSGFVDLVNG